MKKVIIACFLALAFTQVAYSQGKKTEKGNKAQKEMKGDSLKREHHDHEGHHDGMKSDSINKGKAYGKSKGEMAGKEFGKERAAASKGKLKPKKRRN